MRNFFLFILLTAFLSAHGQPDTFPEGWTGTWRGELQWLKAGSSQPQKVVMTIQIKPGDSAGVYLWHLQYGADGSDSRPYILKPVDSSKGHWVIDERNGIVLDQFLLRNRLCGGFTVQNSTLINSYELEGGKLKVEYYTLAAKPLNTTGAGTEESPRVDSYRVSSYQYALLERVK